MTVYVNCVCVRHTVENIISYRGYNQIELPQSKSDDGAICVIASSESACSQAIEMAIILAYSSNFRSSSVLSEQLVHRRRHRCCLRRPYHQWSRISIYYTEHSTIKVCVQCAGPLH